MSPEELERLKEAYRNGYDDGSDPAWVAKRLRRLGLDYEPESPKAREFFLYEYLGREYPNAVDS